MVTSTFTLWGRRGTYGTGLALVTRFPFADGVAAALCVAGVAVGDIDLRFAWQAWHLVASTVTLCGTRVPPLSPRLFAWQARHLVTSSFALRGRRYLVTSTVTLRGRRGTCVAGPRPLLCVARLLPLSPRLFAWHLTTLCVAGVALTALGWLR